MRLTRLGIAITALAAGGAVVAWPEVGSALVAVSGDSFPAALSALGTLALAGVSSWVLLVAAGGLVHVRIPGVPRALRALMFAGVGLGLAATPAMATPHDPTGLPLPDRPLSSESGSSASGSTPRAETTEQPSTARTMQVRAGDSLWHLAADHLPDDADAPTIAAAAERWFVANRDVIGPDPDLIQPGQSLTVPGEDRS